MTPKTSVVEPHHYRGHPSGIEAITIIECFSFNVGSAMKYLWRHALKGSPVTDLRKASYYCLREADRLEKIEKQRRTR